MVDVREVQKPLRKSYQQDPSAAMYVYRARTVDDDLSDPTRITVETVGHCKVRYSVAVNELAGGPGGSPTPGDLMISSLVACRAMAIRMVAAAARFPLTRLEVEGFGDVDHRGVLLVSGAPRVGAVEMRLVVRIGTDPATPQAAIDNLMQMAGRVCAVADNLANPTPIKTTVERI